MAPNNYANEVMSHMAPIGHKHINMRGILRFDFTQHGLGLLQHAPNVSNGRVLK